MVVSALSSVQSLFGGSSSTAAGPAAGSGNFLSLVDSALRSVSDTQNAAAAAESSYPVGKSSATLGNALVASDRAEVAWNATVAVRNEVVSAYQSVMSMQF
jgi:flagellar hook-basal body complex protein FliE